MVVVFIERRYLLIRGNCHLPYVACTLLTACCWAEQACTWCVTWWACWWRWGGARARLRAYRQVTTHPCVPSCSSMVVALLTAQCKYTQVVRHVRQFCIAGSPCLHRVPVCANECKKEVQAYPRTRPRLKKVWCVQCLRQRGARLRGLGRLRTG
jgi:hypothetical protein